MIVYQSRIIYRKEIKSDALVYYCQLVEKRSKRQQGSGEYIKKGYESNIAWTNSTLCASFSAIKRITKGRIARMVQY